MNEWLNEQTRTNDDQRTRICGNKQRTERGTWGNSTREIQTTERGNRVCEMITGRNRSGNEWE